MVEVNPQHVRAFATPAELERWLAAHHGSASELWLKIFKQASGEPTVTYREAVEVGLCWGWIDGLKKALDERSFLQRFTPRRSRSIWSQINRELVAKLIATGRMQAPGLAQVQAAQADGRWEAAYASPRSSSVPPELLAAIEANPRALAMYQKLDRANLYALGFRLIHLKTLAARERKIIEFVALLAEGKTLHPMSPARSTARQLGKLEFGESEPSDTKLAQKAAGRAVPKSSAAKPSAAKPSAKKKTSATKPSAKKPSAKKKASPR